MKKITWIIGLALLAIVPVMAWTSVANAQRFASNVEEGQKVHSSLYSSGKTIDIRGEIFGDVFCAGQTVNIDAIVQADILCAGVDVRISGKVDGDIRVAGSECNPCIRCLYFNSAKNGNCRSRGNRFGYLLDRLV